MYGASLSQTIYMENAFSMPNPLRSFSLNQSAPERQNGSDHYGDRKRAR
jgi:hypothetical protein